MIGPRFRRILVAGVLVALALGGTRAATSEQVLGEIPLREVTIFKDGYAFLLHEGQVPVNEDGNVVVKNLPQAALGTFWPYAADARVKLAAVMAGNQTVMVDRPAQTIIDLLKANAGADVVVNENGVRYPATILGFGPKSPGVPEPAGPFSALDLLKNKENMLYVKTVDGVRGIDPARVQDIEFKTMPKTTVPQEEGRPLITMRLAWGGNAKTEKVAVGMTYLQQGLRWIPEYQIDLDTLKTGAKVKLQATIINDLADLTDVRANLVIGVPNFMYKNELSPMTLRQTAAQLSPHFAAKDSSFSNALSSQVVYAGERSRANPGTYVPEPVAINPEVAGSGKNEDLYLFTVDHLTLKRGERLLLPIAEFTLPGRDLYTLNYPPIPPREVLYQLDGNRQAELIRLNREVRPMHVLRFSNRNGKFPITTAPVLLMRGGQVIAQSMTRYTPVGAELDVPMTAAIDIRVKKLDREAKRTADAQAWTEGTTRYTAARIDMEGTITLTNHNAVPVEVEVTRQLVGNAASATANGKFMLKNLFEDGDYLTPVERPAWAAYWNAPTWWNRFNATSEVTWTVTVEPGKALDLGYTYNYYWR